MSVRAWQEWVPICVKNAALHETGIVAAMASVLAASNISILGCSTLVGGGLATDFTLVPRSQVDEAAAAFEKAGFLLVKKDFSGAAAANLDLHASVDC